MNSAQKLLAGSRAIDRMEKEITEVISMIFGLLTNEEIEKILHSWGGEQSFEIRNSPGNWRIGIGRKRRPYAYCWIQIPDFSSSVYRVYSSKPEEKGFAGARLVAVPRVYAALPSLVDGMAQAFPELAKRMAPFFEAAEMVGE